MKSVDASSSNHRQLHEKHNSTFPTTTTVPKSTKIPVIKVLEENGGKGSAVTAYRAPPFLSQLGKALFSHPSGHPLLDIEKNKAQCINLTKLSGYKGIGEIHTMEDFDKFLALNKGKINYCLCLSVFGSFWYPHLKHLLVPVILGKMCLHHLSRESEEQTDSEHTTVLGYGKLAGKEAIRFITTALQAFFLVSKLEQRRINIIYHSGAT